MKKLIERVMLLSSFIVESEDEQMVSISFHGTRISFWKEKIVGKEDSHILLIPINNNRCPVILSCESVGISNRNLERCFLTSF